MPLGGGTGGGAIAQITGTGTGAIDFGVSSTDIYDPSGNNNISANAHRFYANGQHTPGDLAGDGIQLQAGDDFLGLFGSEKNATTLQIYPDQDDHHAIEFRDRGAAGHFKSVSADGSETTDFDLLHMLHSGTVDPSAGGGVAARIGSFYGRDNSGAGELWLKTGAANTAWTHITAP